MGPAASVNVAQLWIEFHLPYYNDLQEEATRISELKDELRNLPRIPGEKIYFSSQKKELKKDPKDPKGKKFAKDLDRGKSNSENNKSLQK